MPAWLGIALGVMFVSVGVDRARHRDVCGVLMALGMAVMAPGMGGIGPHLVHGAWWAAAFLLVALGPAVALVSRGGTRPTRDTLLHSHLPHLLGGVAMVYMCLAPPGSPASSAADPATVGYQLAAVHDHGGHRALAAIGVISGPESPAVGLFTMFGWLLAGYFLFAAVCVVTRREADARPRCTRRAVTEAVMGLGTLIMLVPVI